MALLQVNPVLSWQVRSLCLRPYPRHPHGCPNYDQRASCPPQASWYADVYDMDAPVYAVVSEFGLGSHMVRMRVSHPDWSLAQLRCVLYLQGTARKALRRKIEWALAGRGMQGYTAETCPEAMGVDVGATLAQVGITLEWPPGHIVRQVALLGMPQDRSTEET